MNLALGPVVAQTGGGLEVVEQQITADGEVSIPSGWGSAYAGFQGTVSGNLTRATILGRENNYSNSRGQTAGGFRLMTAGQALLMEWVTGTLTFIRID